MHTTRRRCFTTPAALAMSSILGGCAWLPTSDDTPRARSCTNAVVDEKFSGPAGALIRGVPYFRTLQQALDAVPDQHAHGVWRIAIRKGRYREKLEIRKSNVHLIGEERESTFISFDAYAGQTRPSGVGTWTTYGCATLTVRAPGFAASSLTIENSFDYLSNDAKSPTDPSYTNDPQAVALMLASGSDKAVLRNVSMTGYQDTLFVDAGRSYFRDCCVSGNVDFIFGAGQAVFEACEIVSRPRRKPNVAPHGYVTAPSTQLQERHGLLFLHCKLIRENAQVPANSHALGRPWHPAVTFPDGRYADPNAVGSSVFIECFMDDHIAEVGWWSMTGLQKSGPTRTVFLPEDSRFFEYRSHGPGASKPGNVKRRQLSSADAARYTLADVFSDWKP
ncbi:MAG: pectin esterase [Betaproteobacteria bacterium]|nr:MAG: pectin esterase [Betaproteobacteria bacterium]